MLGNLTKFLSQNFSLFCALLIVQILPLKTFAADYVSTGDVVKEIEKTLLFDKDAREQIDFYQKKTIKRSDINIVANVSDQQSSSANNFDVVVVDPKNGNYDEREKEKIAYNSVLIGQYEVAIELYKQVLAVEPDNKYDKFSLAVVYQKIGQFRQAKALYYELLKSNPENQEEIVGNLLAILVEESPKDAVYLLSRLTIQNPSSAYIFAQAALAYDKVKNYDQAINLLQKAIALDGSNVDYKYNLAVTYDKTGQFDKALESYQDITKDYSEGNESVSIDKINNRIESIKKKLAADYGDEDDS